MAQFARRHRSWWKSSEVGKDVTAYNGATAEDSVMINRTKHSKGIMRTSTYGSFELLTVAVSGLNRGRLPVE